MLTELKVQKFKGIGSCDVNGLGRVNLFIGKNDSGKSTILEGAYYLFRELCAPPQLQAIMSKRSNVFVGGSELWFNYDTSSEITINAVFDEVRLDWKIMAHLEPRETYITSRLFAGKVQVILLGETRYSGTTFSMTMSSGGPMIGNIKERQEYKDGLTRYASNMSFIDCTLKSHTREIEGILAKFKRVPTLESRFGEMLNDIYGKGKDWQFIPQLENTDERRLAIKEGGQLKYFGGFGDGLRCSVGILGTAMSVKNTAIFIEEIESHQHSGSLSKIIGHLVQIARKNDLQIFLSTHSKDAWESLVRGVYLDDEKKEKEEFRCFLVQRDLESGKVTAECTTDLQKITEALE